MQAPSLEQARRALGGARRLFVHALSGWVTDLLSLRRAGLTDAEWTPTSSAAEEWTPTSGGGVPEPREVAAAETDSPPRMSDAA